MKDSVYTESLNNLIAQFGTLPGIGPKTAERLAFHVLRTSPEEALALAKAISDVKTNTTRCKVCFNLAESETCSICADPGRDRSIICVVEQPKDVISLEKTGLCKWVYHVLNGHIAPLEGVEPADLTIDELIKRLQGRTVREVVMATNPNLEGDGTALYISSLLRGFKVSVTRLARGLPAGGSIEYAGSSILADAILGRARL